ncbi:hypothetical protein PMZ80_004554 [Knufia obscura]|uniref:Methyltransferase type 11 domain-containing protein n=1 Tax=Knufia obscura TaxID=1635080 RepID=A0ABR0RSF4_9EURO|nr:hypothetical protein PMZ80_004554 [Knufia obscura]
MTQDVSQSTGDSWKELAQKSRGYKAGSTTQSMVARMNEIWPFSTARGLFDNGCGTGAVISAILDAYGVDIPAAASVLAGDFSQPMLEVLIEAKQSKSTASEPAWDRLEIRQIDAHDLSTIATASVSHVTGGHLYFLLSDAQMALAETHRVLCPGGVLGMTSGKGSQHIDTLRDAFEQTKPGTKLNLIQEPWSSEEGVRGILEAAGFVSVEISLVESEVAYQTYEDFAETLMLMPVVKNITASYEKEECIQVQQYLTRNLREINPRAPGTLKGVSIIAHARKAPTSSKEI